MKGTVELRSGTWAYTVIDYGFGRGAAVHFISRERPGEHMQAEVASAAELARPGAIEAVAREADSRTWKDLRGRQWRLRAVPGAPEPSVRLEAGEQSFVLPAPAGVPVAELTAEEIEAARRLVEEAY